MSVSLYGSGQTVIQVVQAISTTSSTTSSSSYVTTGFSATITPQSTNSKILVMAEISYSTGSASGAGMGFAIYRGATAIWTPAVADASGAYGAAYSQAANGNRGQSPLIYLDSPATTSATTYNIYFAIRNSSGTFNPTDAVNNGSSSLTLLEISGS